MKIACVWEEEEADDYILHSDLHPVVTDRQTQIGRT